MANSSLLDSNLILGLGIGRVRSANVGMIMAVFLADVFWVLDQDTTLWILHDSGMVSAKCENPLLGIVKQLWIFLDQSLGNYNDFLFIS